MTKSYPKLKLIVMVFLFAAGVAVFLNNKAIAAVQGERPQPLLLSEPKEPLEVRLQRKITLDVRDMNIVDVVKFLAQKGDFNVVVSPTVDGRTTVFLNSVAIKDALDIVVKSNRLAYYMENNIVHVMTSAEFESVYGRTFSDKTIVEVIHLSYSKPSYVLAALDNIKSNIGKIIIDEDTGSVVLIDTVESLRKMKEAIAEIEKPLDTIVYNLQYAKADVVAEKLRQRIDAKAVGSITPDERTNQLLVRVFPGRHSEVEDIIAKLDQADKEVIIEARILEVILKPTYDVGVDWTIGGGDGSQDLVFKNMMLNEAGLTSSDSLTNTFGKIAVGQVNVDDFTFNIRALEQVSDTKIVASPQLLVVNNEEARIHIGDTVPYIISTTSGTGDNAITSEDVRFVDVGLKLNVRPIINDDGMVTMYLRPEISSVVSRLESNQGGIPQVNKTEVETTVMVADGETIIMAGLRKEDKIHVKKGVPVLMDMPYLERIFSRTSDSITSTEIVIFITPTIVSGREGYKDHNGTIKPAKTYTQAQAK